MGEPQQGEDVARIIQSRQWAATKSYVKGREISFGPYRRICELGITYFHHIKYSLALDLFTNIDLKIF